MPSYQVITRSAFASQHWGRYQSYDFAAIDAVAPLVAQELAKACLCLPIGFLLQHDNYTPVAVQGLAPGQNLFVFQGKWIAAYTPAAYRGYPFAVTQGKGDALHLCVDMDSGLVGETGDQPFFDATGEASPDVKAILGFLEQVHRNRAVTARVCAALAAEHLFQPWPLTVKTADGERAIEGLYRIDEARLNKLDPDGLARVHRAGGLPVAYCQLLSMGHVQTLGLISRKLEELGKKSPQMADQINLDRVLHEHRMTAPLENTDPDHHETVVSLTVDEGDMDLTAFMNTAKADHT